MALKRKRATKVSERIPSITPDRLIRGWSGPRGMRIRLLAVEEVDRWLELLEAVHIEHEEALLAALRDGTLGRLLPAGLTGGSEALLDEFGQELFRGEPVRAMAGLSAALVAEDREGRLVGALHALPPASVLAQVITKGVPAQLATVAALAVVKIRAVAVDERARGLGVGSALLRRCLQLYFQLGYYVAYGQFSSGSGLETYYAQRGFEILAEGEGLDLTMNLGLPFGINAEPGERLFVRWRAA
jgi:GNAT superfamily N-acetyltransferase